MSSPVRARRVPALDGVRGVAVAAVVLFHAGHLTGGYLGVDVFFVLSGFLITSLLLDEGTATSGIRLLGFWARRARRLLPALMVLILGVALYTAFLAAPPDVSRIRGDAWSTVLYVANWHSIAAKTDYWSLFRSPSPLEHTWSLAIEEQFYLVWPLVVLGLLAWRGRDRFARTVAAAAAGGAALSYLLMAALYEPDRTARAYYGTDTRAGAVLLGATAAALLTAHGPVTSVRARRVLEVTGWVGLTVLTVLAVGLHGDSPVLYRGGFLLGALAALAVIATVTHPTAGALTRLLSFRPLCLLGVISYGVYLWHWPVDVMLTTRRTDLEGWPLIALQAATTLVIATASYVLVERPIRAQLGPPAVRRIAIAGLVTCSVTALVVVVPGSSAPRRTTAFAAGPTLERLDLRGLAKQVALIDRLSDPAARRILVVGDSTAFTLAEGAPVGGPDVAVTSAAVLGCGVVPGRPDAPGFDARRAARCDVARSRWARAATIAAPDAVVVLTGPWDLMDRTLDGSEVVAGTAEWRRAFDAALDRLVASVTTPTRPMVALTTACIRPASATFSGDLGDRLRSPRLVDAMNTRIRALARRHPTRVTVADAHGLVCPDGRQAEPGFLDEDGVHFTTTGARRVWQWLAPQLRARPDASADEATPSP